MEYIFPFPIVLLFYNFFIKDYYIRETLEAVRKTQLIFFVSSKIKFMLQR